MFTALLVVMTPRYVEMGVRTSLAEECVKSKSE